MALEMLCLFEATVTDAALLHDHDEARGAARTGSRLRSQTTRALHSVKSSQDRKIGVDTYEV